MSSIIILITALFTPVLAIPTGNAIPKKRQHIFYLFLLGLSFLSWLVLFIKSQDVSGMLLSSPVILDIAGKKFFFKLLLNPTSFLFLSMILLQIILLVFLNYLNDESDKFNIWDYSPLHIPFYFITILSSSIFIAFMSFMAITFINLYLDMASTNLRLQKKGLWIFFGQGIFDIYFLITCLAIMNDTNFSSELLGLNSNNSSYGNTLEQTLVSILMLKAFWMILENAFFVSAKNISRVITETSSGLIILSLIIFRFLLSITKFSLIGGHVLLILVPMTIYCGHNLILQNSVRRAIVSISMMFCAYMLVMSNTVGPSLIVYMTLVYLVVINAFFVFYFTGKFSDSMDEGHFGVNIWSKAYWIILLAPMAMFPGGYLYWPMRELLWGLAQKHRIVEFSLIVILVGSLVWFLSKIFFQHFAKESANNQKATQLLFKIFVGVFLAITIMLSSCYAPENTWLLNRSWFSFLELKPSITTAGIISVNIWFSLVWSVLFILELAGLYILYVTSDSGKNLDEKYQQISGLIAKHVVDLWDKISETFKIISKYILKFILLGCEYGHISKSAMVKLLRRMNFLGSVVVKYLEFKSMQSKIDSFMWILIILVIMYFSMR